MYGESACSSSASICLRVSRIVNSFMSRQKADDGVRLVPVAHGATLVHLARRQRQRRRRRRSGQQGRASARATGGLAVQAAAVQRGNERLAANVDATAQAELMLSHPHLVYISSTSSRKLLYSCRDLK
jgi:hypothetical protein